MGANKTEDNGNTVGDTQNGLPRPPATAGTSHRSDRSAHSEYLNVYCVQSFVSSSQILEDCANFGSPFLPNSSPTDD